MSASVIIALVGLVITVGTTVFAIGKIIGAFTAKIAAELEALKQIVVFRLENLEKKQDKYNHLQERVIGLERDNKTLFNLIKGANNG